MRISDWSSDVCSSDLKRRAFGNGDDVGARHRDIVDGLLAEMEEIAQHLALDLRQVADDIAAAPVLALFLGLVDDLFDLFAQRRFLVAPEQQVSQSGPHPGPATVPFRSVRRSLVVGHFSGFSFYSCSDY